MVAFDAMHTSTSRTSEAIHHYNSIQATTPVVCMHVYPLNESARMLMSKKNSRQKKEGDVR